VTVTRGVPSYEIVKYASKEIVINFNYPTATCDNFPTFDIIFYKPCQEISENGNTVYFTNTFTATGLENSLFDDPSCSGEPQRSSLTYAQMEFNVCLPTDDDNDNLLYMMHTTRFFMQPIQSPTVAPTRAPTKDMRPTRKPTISANPTLTPTRAPTFPILRNAFGAIIATCTSSSGSGCCSLCTEKPCEMTFSSSITSISDNAFEDCSSFTSLIIPNSVISIGVYAFKSCTSMVSVSIPTSVTFIGLQAFQSCSSLTSVTIPSSMTTLEYATFIDCSSLTSVTIPDSVTRLENSVFLRCPFTCIKWNPAVTRSIGGAALPSNPMPVCPMPTTAPTLSPTTFPTSLSPTTFPTPPTPSTSPTFHPSLRPTFKPSKLPTFLPTIPTLKPSSYSPTVVPTVMDGISAYYVRLMYTSGNELITERVYYNNDKSKPTTSPTLRPSLAPTARPSLAPTIQPTPKP